MSFLIEQDPIEEAIAELVTETGTQLQCHVANARNESRLNQQKIATRIGRNRSWVNRRLSGYANLTLKSLAMLCFAIDKRPVVVILDDDEEVKVQKISTSLNYTAVSPHSNMIVESNMTNSAPPAQPSINIQRLESAL